MMKAAGRFLLCVALTAVSVSCFHKEDFDMGKLASDPVHYDIAMPLVNAHLTLENIIDTKGGLFVPDENGLLHLVYTTAPYEKKIIDNLTFNNYTVRLNASGIPYKRLDTLLAFHSQDSATLETLHLPQGTEIKKIYLNSVRLSFSVSNRFLDPLDWKVRFPNVKDASGAEISLQRRIEGDHTEEIVVEYPQLCIEMEGPTPYVLREDEVQVDMRNMTEDSTLYRGGYDIQGSLSNLLFSRLEGYMGTVDFAFVGLMPIEGLGLERMEDVTFNAATLNTDLLLKGVSAPVRISKSVVEIRNQTGVQEMEVFEPGYDVPYPPFDKVPLEEETTTKSDVKDMLVDRPSRISFAVQGAMNPDGERDQMQAFEQDASIRMTLACDVPAWFSASNYTLSDTIALSLVGDDTQVNYFTLKTIFKNAFPLDFSVDLVFLKRDYSSALVLFEDRVVESATVGPEPDLHVVEPSVAGFEEELNEEQVAAVREAAYVAIRARINTYQKGDVKIYMPSDNESFFNVKVGFRAKVEQSNLF